MSSLLLKWVANGLIAAVLACTVWMAHSVRPDSHASPLMLAHAAAAPAAPASAATR